jgi:hypothetical protein
MAEKINAYRLLVGKPDGKRQLEGQDTGGWIIRIKKDLLEIGWGGVDWICLAQDRDKWRDLGNLVLNIRVPLNAGKLSSVQKTRDLSNSVQLHRVS